MKKLANVAFGLVAILVLGACQAVFTYSPFEFLQRDLAALPAEQQVKRAEDALGTGDTAQMAEAYSAVVALLVDSDDPSLDLLAADLAFGASGMTEVFSSVLADPTTLSGGVTPELTAILEEIDIDLIAAGVGHIQDADAADADVSDSQYVIAGAALLASAVEKAGSFDAIADPIPTDAWYQDVQDAESFLTAGGATDLLSMFNL